MNFGVFRTYYELQADGYVPNIVCGNDDSHLGLIPNVDSEDRIFLYCLECDYKKYPGLEFYKKIKDLAEKVYINVGTQE
jgi:hypothetical protein